MPGLGSGVARATTTDLHAGAVNTACSLDPARGEQGENSMKHSRTLWIAIGTFWLGATGCSKSEPTPPAAPAAPPSAPVAAAPTAPNANSDDPAEVFKARCVMCHGESGKGDGAASVALNPKPRNYTDKEWQKTVTDDQIKKTITGGGASMGKSALMPPQPDLAVKPAVLDGLVKIIRAFGA
jgi:mono/diheme cytochrome c family protein